MPKVVRESTVKKVKKVVPPVITDLSALSMRRLPRITAFPVSTENFRPRKTKGHKNDHNEVMAWLGAVSV